LSEAGGSAEDGLHPFIQQRKVKASSSNLKRATLLGCIKVGYFSSLTLTAASEDPAHHYVVFSEISTPVGYKN
jgi:hypothetical protein